MTLRERTLLLVTGLLVVAVITLSAVLTWASTAALLAQTEDDGVLIAHLLAKSIEFADDVVGGVEDIVGGQMIVQATLAAHLVALGEAHGASTEEIAARLRDVTRRTALDEFWITDETGHAYLHSLPHVDFTFSPDPARQPQASAFWPLLDGGRTRVIQASQPRELDTRVFKYVGVAGVDRPRIVQVGYDGEFLERLRDQVGLQRLIQELVDDGNVVALRVVGPNMVTLAYSAVPGRQAEDVLNAANTASINRAIAYGEATSRLTGDVLAVTAPIANSATGYRTGAAIVELSTQHVFDAQRRQIELAALVAATVLGLGGVASTVLARRVTQPVAQLTAAAAALEAQAAMPTTLADVAQRRDELGQLARVFMQMAREVYAREERLLQQVQALRIEIDQSKRARQVAEITETDYFQQLQQRAKALRARPSETES